MNHKALLDNNKIDRQEYKVFITLGNSSKLMKIEEVQDKACLKDTEPVMSLLSKGYLERCGYFVKIKDNS